MLLGKMEILASQRTPRLNLGVEAFLGSAITSRFARWGVEICIKLSVGLRPAQIVYLQISTVMVGFSVGYRQCTQC